MEVVRSVRDVRAALQEPRRAGRRIGLVPTMGAFHEGHLSLMRRARAECAVVVVSLFVNPAQFRPGEDLASYPRDEAGDLRLAAAAGVNLVFAPPVEEVYPPGFATSVRVRGVSEPLEGAVRGVEHFDGVTTVVAKLFNMVGPDVAYFGQKDAQQALVIQRLVRDLDFPLAIAVCPTVREPDGLAMSSRNAYLEPADRTRAAALRRALAEAEAAVAEGERDTAAIAARARAVLAEAGIEPQYLEVVSPVDARPLERVDSDALVVVAAVVGDARLIDNTLVSAVVQPHAHAPARGNLD
jgi:pantoate--beta-alanine ligase